MSSSIDIFPMNRYDQPRIDSLEEYRMSLHLHFDQHQKTASVAKTILERFEQHGVRGIINAPPEMHQTENNTGSLITFRNLIQCAQGSWRVSVNVSHFSDLSESTVNVCLDYDFPATRSKKEPGTATLFMSLKPYVQTQPSARILTENEDHLSNAFELIKYRPRQQISASQDVHESVFWTILEKLIQHTAERNRSAPGKRRSKASALRTNLHVS